MPNMSNLERISMFYQNMSEETKKKMESVAEVPKYIFACSIISGKNKKPMDGGDKY